MSHCKPRRPLCHCGASWDRGSIVTQPGLMKPGKQGKMELIWLVSLPMSHLTGLPDPSMSRAASHQPLENWGPMPSVLRKRSIGLSRCPQRKLILPLKKSLYARVLPDKSCLDRTERPSWPWPLSHLKEALRKVFAHILLLENQ